MPTGRPTDYKQAYCNEVKDHLAEGFTLASWAGTIGICRATAYNWSHNNPDFLDAIKIGRAKGQLVWEKRLANQALTNAGNTASIIFAMKNLYQDDWADKIVNEHTGKDGGAIKTESTVTIDPTKLSDAAIAELLNATTNTD